MKKRILDVVRSNKALVLADQAVFSGSSFLVTLLAARLLTVSDFGVYSGIILGLYLLISMSNALVIQPYQVSHARVSQKEKYINFVFWLQMLLVAIIALGVWIVSQFSIVTFTSFIGEAILLSTGFLLHDFLRKLFLAGDKVRQAFWLDLVIGASQISFLVILFFAGALSLSWVIIATGISYMVSAMLGIYFLKPGFNRPTGWSDFFSDHVTQGKWLLLTAVIQWGSGNLFIVTAGIFLGPVALGAFRLVQSLFGVLNLVLQTYENYVLPQAVRLFTESFSESKKYLRNVSVRGALLFGSVLLILFIFSEQIIYVVGGTQYVSYAYVVRGMAVLYFVIFLGYPIRMAVRMLVMNNIFFMGYAISFCFSLLSFQFLLKEYQLWGAIIGLIVNQLILVLFWQYCLAKRHFILWR